MKRHALTIAGLLGLCCAVQAWCVTRAVTPAQDAVRFTKVAQAIEREGLLNVLCTRDEHPLFPAAVCLTHQVRGLWLPETADAWATSAQFAAALALVLAVVPVYGLLLCLTRWPAAVTGALFFCLMTPVARLGADGLSDSTHLCLLCVALWATVKWFAGPKGSRGAPPFDVGRWTFVVGRSASRTEHRTSNVQRPTSNRAEVGTSDDRFAASSIWLFLAGLFLALAALARKEALVLAPAIGLTVLAIQFTPWRQRWRNVLWQSLCLGLGMAIVVGPYLAASDALAPRQAVGRLFGHSLDAESSDGAPAAVANSAPPAPKKRSSRWRTSDGQRMAFTKKDSQASIRFHGYGAALREFARELPSAFNYWIGGLALVGIWGARKRVWRPSGVFVLAFVLIYSAAAIYFAAGSGYLAPRHLLPLVVLGLSWAGEGAIGIRNAEFGMRNWLSRRRLQLLQFRIPHSAFRILYATAPALLVTLAAAACLPRTLAPLHASRLGHRQAAQWLASQPEPDDTVLDTRGFTRFFSGRKTYDFEQGKQALRDPRLAYIVVEHRELEYDSHRGQTLRELLARGSRLMGRFAADSPGVEPVEVYQWGPSALGQGKADTPVRHADVPGRTRVSALPVAALR